LLINVYIEYPIDLAGVDNVVPLYNPSLPDVLLT
jgi:hypothetical protein